MWRPLLLVTSVVLLAMLGAGAGSAGKPDGAGLRAGGPGGAGRVGVANAAGVAAPGDPAAGPMRARELARFERATVVAGLAVVVERGSRWLVAQHEARYVIAIRNQRPDTERLIVRVAVPPWLTAAAPAGAVAGDGYIDWPVTLAPGGITTLRLSGAYAAPGPGVPQQVAFTACALDADDGRPIACATDLSELHPPGWYAWWALGGLSVLVAAGLVVKVWRLRRAGSLRLRWRSAASGR
jgi:hypothetical protein